MNNNLIGYSIRQQYENSSVTQYYQTLPHTYINLHQDQIKYLISQNLHLINLSHVLDFCAGDGLITSILLENEVLVDDACDPFLFQEYQKKTGRSCQTWSFIDIIQNGLPKKYSSIIASFCLHLCPKKQLHDLLYQLSLYCDQLVILSPNKSPIINTDLFELTVDPIKYNRVTMRIYKSKLH